MLNAISRPFVRVVERWLPGSMVFAVALTFIVAGLALVLTPAGPVGLVRAWGDGLTGLLAFMTQMCLVLLLGSILANTGPVKRLLRALAAVPRTPAQAYAWVFLVAALASLFTWGLGLVVGAMLSMEVARVGRERGLRLHYPLLVAAGYSGFVVWHMGYSGSGPLAAATPGSMVEKQIGRTIPVTDTIFAWWNLTGIALTVLACAIAMYLLAPRPGDPVRELPVEALAGPAPGGTSPQAAGYNARTGDTSLTPADRIDGSRAVPLALGLMLLAYLVVYFAQEGFTLTLDIVNWTFLALILLLVRSTTELGSLVADAARNVGEILVQFPLYAGIMGLMAYSAREGAPSLISVFSDLFVSISTPQTLGLWCFLAGGLVNFFVPSGGGQFAIQAPIFFSAAERLGVDPAVVTMGVAYGDQWTNMVQPFWALPLLAIAGLRIRDILGYTSVTLLVSGACFAAAMLLSSM